MLCSQAKQISLQMVANYFALLPMLIHMKKNLNMQLQCNIKIQQYIITRFTILKIQGRFVIELKKYTYESK